MDAFPREPELRTGSELLYRVVATESDDINLALPRIRGDLYRSSSTAGEVVITIRAYERLHLMTMDFGYQIVGQAAPDEESVVLGCILEAPPGARWDGRDLTTGDVVLYPRGAGHAAIDAQGLRIGVITIDHDWLKESIEDLGRRPVHLERGPLREDLAHQVMEAFRQIPSHDDPGVMISAMASVLSTEPVTRPEHQRTISSEVITRRAIDYAYDTGDWSPSSTTLCRSIGVSERRLQLAFAEMYGMSPSAFMRHRALSIARSRLLDADEGMAAPVTSIASGLGLNHLGRFAVEYRRQFGETPSDTLARGNGQRSR